MKGKTERFDGTKFTEPRIYPKDYRTNKGAEFFISWSERVDGKLRTIKKRFDINSHTGSKKVARAEAFLESVIISLQLQKKEPSEFENLSLIESLCFALNAEYPAWSKKTVSSYLSSGSIFLRFLHEKRYNDLTAVDFTRAMAKEYSDYLLKSYAIRTHNNRLTEAGTFFGYLFEREIIEVNPFDRVKRKRAPAGGQLPFSLEQLENLRKKLDPDTLLFLDFAVDSLLRSAEFERLKIKDLLFESSEIVIISNEKSGRRTKDKQTRYVKLKADTMERIKILVHGFDPEYYVFGVNFKPRPQQIRKDAISKRFTEIIRSLGYGKEYSLYSTRKTGSIIKWKVEKCGSEELMNMLGHSDWSSTMHYLKDILGVYDRRG